MEKPRPGAAAWLPDPDGGDFQRWWDGKQWTKRVQGGPPTAMKAAASPQSEPKPDPEPQRAARTRIGRAPVRVLPPLEVVPEVETSEAEPEEVESDAAALPPAWGYLPTGSAVLGALGILTAVLLPMRVLPIILSSLGVLAGTVALVLAFGDGSRKVASVWGMGLGAVGAVLVLMFVNMPGSLNP